MFINKRIFGSGIVFLQINVVTQRGFIPVDERMRVFDADGNLVCWYFSYKHAFCMA